jgi:O-antigen biosynthesis alpha-1,2-mannosyltransferase
LRIALDATYSLGPNLSGVGVYSREILHGLAQAQPRERFYWCYRPHRYLNSFAAPVPANCRRRLLLEPLAPRSAAVFHGLNQRLPKARFRRRITTFHDLFVLTGEYSTPEFRSRFAAQAREAASASDLILTVSQFTAGQVHDLLGVERSRLRVVHHGVRITPLRPAPKRQHMVLHVGAIQARKNIARLVEAFEVLPANWSLVLAGSAGYGAESILRRIEDSPARPRITVTGWLPDEELARFYARARIFAFPSLDEGFGMPVLEAMASSIPVLTSNRSALPEVAGDAALLVDPMRTEEIAGALLRLAGDQELGDEMKKRGLERAAQFTWELAVEKTWKAYNDL